MEVTNMIDFKKIAEIVPENGSLSMMFQKRKDGRLVVVYAPNYGNTANTNSDDEKKAISPATFVDTPEGFNASFEEKIKDLANEQKKLVELLKVNTRATNKKADVAKAAAAKNADIAKAKAKEEGNKAAPSTDKGKTPAPAPLLDLFSASSTKAAAETDKAEEKTTETEVEYNESCACG